MPRPKSPLISRRPALEAALAIADSEGLAALSIRRLGVAMNVNGASLYHHFRNKEEILVGITELALADVATPRSEGVSWRTWLPLNAERTRDALVRHPALIPIMLRRAPLGIGTSEIESTVRRLRSEGVPLSMVVPLMEGLELLAISSALQEVNTQEVQARRVVPEDGAAVPVGPAATPALDEAVAARGLASSELFEVMANSMISIIESSIQLRDTRRASELLASDTAN